MDTAELLSKGRKHAADCFGAEMYVAILGLVGGRLERGRPEEQSYFRTLQQAMCSLSVQRKPGWTGGARDPALLGAEGWPQNRTASVVRQHGTGPGGRQGWD